MRHRPDADSDESTRLLDRLRGGEAVFDRLFERHRGPLRDAVSLRFDRALRGRADPSDVVQEAQLEAFRRLASYLDEPVIPFRLWLRRIAHDRLIMLRRRHLGALRRTVRRELPLPERSSVLLAQNLVAEDKSPSKQVSQRELAEQVRTAMGELPDSDLEILLMRTFEAMPFEEIGYVLNIKPATARKRHGRALVRLHHSLVALGISGSTS